MKIFLSFIINIVFFCGYLGANPRVLMKHYTTENGLANNNVNCLIKDKDGFFGLEPGMAFADMMDIHIRSIMKQIILC